jgi:hypothetical protein
MFSLVSCVYYCVPVLRILVAAFSNICHKNVLAQIPSENSEVFLKIQSWFLFRVVLLNLWRSKRLQRWDDMTDNIRITNE